MFSRFMNNRRLLNKKQYFREPQEVDNTPSSTKREKPYSENKISPKELNKIKEEMSVEEKKELDRKVLILLLSVILTVILISLLIYFLKFLPEDFLDFPSDKG